MGLLPVIVRAALKTAYCKPSGVAEEILFTLTRILHEFRYGLPDYLKFQ
jgi:hypothetical protein